MRAEQQEEGVLTCQIDGTKARCNGCASETVLEGDRSAMCLRAMRGHMQGQRRSKHQG
jgi:hypothetical protein